MVEKLRISGGTMRGRKIFSPPKSSIRPASDMIRQAVFNMVREETVDSHFYDVFAGTGIVGMEALSRGAQYCTFVELEKNQIQLIHKNIERLELQEYTQVLRSDAIAWSRRVHFDPDVGNVVFLGPPYPYFEKNVNEMMTMLDNVLEKMRPGDACVLQYPREVSAGAIPQIDNVWRLRHYGKTSIAIWTEFEVPVEEKSNNSSAHRQMNSEFPINSEGALQADSSQETSNDSAASPNPDQSTSIVTFDQTNENDLD